MTKALNKTLLIVGAGFGQLPAIEKAKELGLTVVVVDKNPDAPGMSLAHFAYATDIIDFDGVLKIARKHNINGVMTMQTDLPIPTIGKVNDELNLNGVSYQTAIYCSHKMETRKILKKKDVSQPEFEIIKTIDEAKKASLKIKFPFIMKAVDSSGSRGVTKVTCENEIESAYNEALKYTRQNDVLVEEFIDGIELGAQAFSINGKCKIVLLHNDTIAKGDYMVPTGHSFPCNLTTDEISYAENAVKQCVEALEINEGPSNIDLILDKNGKTKIIEVGARIGATCLPELVKYYTGIDWVEVTILNALGEQINLKQIIQQPCAAVILESPKDGIIRNINIPKEVLKHKNLLELEITKDVGSAVNKLRKGTDRIGKIVVKSDSSYNAERLAESLKEKVIFDVQN
jgi:biotin carboxylase